MVGYDSLTFITRPLLLCLGSSNTPPLQRHCLTFFVVALDTIGRDETRQRRQNGESCTLAVVGRFVI
jgi:hypothetical protein